MDPVDLMSSIRILNPSDHTMSLTPLEKILITVICVLVYYIVKLIKDFEDRIEALVETKVEERYKSILEENKRLKEENKRFTEMMAGMEDSMEALVEAKVEKRYKRILEENERFKKEIERFKKENERFKEEMTGIVQGVRNELTSDFRDIIVPLFEYIRELSDRQQNFGLTLIRLSDAHRETENLVTIVEVKEKVEELVLSKLESRHPDNLVKLGTTRLYAVDGDAFKNLSERPTPKKGEIDSSSVLALKKASKKFANQDTSCKENPTRYRNNKCHGAVRESLDTATAELLQHYGAAMDAQIEHASRWYSPQGKRVKRLLISKESLSEVCEEAKQLVVDCEKSPCKRKSSKSVDLTKAALKKEKRSSKRELSNIVTNINKLLDDESLHIQMNDFLK